MQIALCFLKDEIVGTSYLAAEYLKAKNFKGTVYVVGSTGITKELDLLGIKHVGLDVNKCFCVQQLRR